MTDEQPPSSQAIKAQQKHLLILCVGVLAAFLLGLYFFIDTSAPKVSKRKDVMETVSLVGPLDHLSTQSVLMARSQNAWKEATRQTAELKTEVEALKKAQATLPSVVNTAPPVQEIVTQETAAEKSKPAPKDVLPFSPFHTPPLVLSGGEEVASEPLIENTELPTGITIHSLALKPRVPPAPSKNPDSFVPAGAFAQAVMLGAADASAGVMSQANPSPMLFRLIAAGNLPNHAHSHLKDCMVTAAVVGDISSERGQIRLERLSCTFPNGEIVEQPVEGTVFALDAKNGVRGHAVWREGAMVGRATLAGMLSGLASPLANATAALTTSPNGASALLKASAAQGGTTALDKLAQYHIQRAEQYHPVIQLSAGQVVDVVFLKGFYLDGRKHEETVVSDSTAPSLFPSFTATESSSGLTLSPEQIEKIKAREAAGEWDNTKGEK